MTGRSERPVTVRVWDPVVRFFHWGLIASLTVAWVTRGTWDQVHKFAGYAMAVLLVIRLIWGFAGSTHARFSDFVKTPRTTLGYMRAMMRGRAPRQLGHNPPGAAMILALMVLLAAIVITGHMMTTNTYFGVDWVENAHKFTTYIVLGLASLHIAGVLFSSLEHRENLIAAMVSGRKRALESTSSRFRTLGLLASLATVFGLLAVLAGLVNALSLNLPRFERELVRAVERSTGRKLVIGEPFDMSLFPKLAITGRNLRLDGAGGPNDRLSIETVVAEIDPLAILNGRFDVTSVTMAGLDLAIEQDPTLAAEDFASDTATTLAASPVTPLTKIFPRARLIRLDDVKIRMLDGGASPLGPHTLSIILAATGYPVETDVQVSAMINDTPLWLNGTARSRSALAGRVAYQLSFAGTSRQGRIILEGGIVGPKNGGAPALVLKGMGDPAVLAALQPFTTGAKPTVIAENTATDHGRGTQTDPAPDTAATAQPSNAEAASRDTPDGGGPAPPDGSATKSGTPTGGGPAPDGDDGKADGAPFDMAATDQAAADDDTADADLDAFEPSLPQKKQRQARARRTSDDRNRVATDDKAARTRARFAAASKVKARQQISKLKAPGLKVRAAIPAGSKVKVRKRKAEDDETKRSRRKRHAGNSGKGKKGHSGNGGGYSGGGYSGSGSSGSGSSGSGSSGSGNSGSGSSGSGGSGSGGSGSGGSGSGGD